VQFIEYTLRSRRERNFGIGFASKLSMRLFAFALLPVLAAAAEDVDLHEVAARAVRNYQKNQVASLRYEYIEDDDIKSKGLNRSRVSTLFGTPYERLIGKKGNPLPADAEKHEEQKFEKTQFQRQNELKGQHDNRVRKWKEQTRFLEEAPDAFEFTLLPDAEMNGRPAYVIDCKPKPGFVAREDRSKMFEKIEAKAWVDKQDLQIVKLEAETLDPVSIGWVLARIGRGTHMELEQMRLDDGNWVLKKLSIEGRAKVMLVDNKQLDETVVYSEYNPMPVPVK
jgi:hypothetical protein